MRPHGTRVNRRFLAAEVVQTSAMDCGPAALKCLLEGFGIQVSYGRLREACQTDVDGTSIDTIEEAAVQLGLDAEQVMVPVDHLFLPAASALPALAVVRLAHGFTHFVVVWRHHGRVAQIMDPATGRRWPTCRRFLDELYIHTQPLPVTTWRAWAETDEFVGTLRHRWALLGLAGPETERALAAAAADTDWYPLATLDATTRMLDALVRAGGCGRGRAAARLFAACYEHAQHQGLDALQTIPEVYWTVRPTPPDPDGEAYLLFRGAVLVRVRGRCMPPGAQHPERSAAATSSPRPLSPELAAALAEPPSAPGRTLLRLLHADGLLAPAVLVAGLALAAAGVMLEALLLRGLFDLSRELSLVPQRLGALAALLVFLATLLSLDLSLSAGLLRLGRQLETRLRLAFLEKIPRLGDRYFQSRPTSDMAERSHAVHQVRLLPVLGGQCVQLLCELVLVTGGLIWLAPASTPVICLAAVCAAGFPYAVQPVLMERDLRVRTHAGALGRFYLDALLGLIAVRTHGAERALQREHEGLLVDWARAGLALQRTVVRLEGVQAALGFGLAVWLLSASVMGADETVEVLLLTYWALSLPVLGQEMALLVRQYPRQRNVTLRLLEPLGALEEPTSALSPPAPAVVPYPQGVALTLQHVSVCAAGHPILTDLDCSIPAGSHVAIVGPSGAGKSSLVGLLLGWHRAASGQVYVDGVPLDGARLAHLRQETAWVDPAVQLWNRSLLHNLLYGTYGHPATPLAAVLEQAELRRVLDTLPEGLQTALGEGGGLLSGGEGQRVRLGRALLRPGVRLVLLDEPFRGLDHQQRQMLLARARSLWQKATLLCITHDVSATQGFERVLVMEGGRLVEDAAPAALAAQPCSRYRALLDAEAMVRERLWSNQVWRRVWLAGGRLVDGHGQGAP